MKVLKAVVNVLAWVVLILALLITIIVFSSERNNGVANLMGFIPLTVESDSMKPTFSQGDLIICREVDDINTLAEGDVITFWTIIDGKRVKNTHRIVGINQEENSRSFVTRGDANMMDDTMPAYAGDVIGKWTEFRLGGAGKAMGFLRTKTGFFVCIIIPMAIFFLFELYKFIVTLVEVKRPAVEEIDEEEIKRRAVEEYLAAQKQKEEQAAAEKAEETKPAEAPEKAEETKPAEAPEKAEETKPAEAPEKAEETKPAEVTEKAEETKPAEAPEKAEETKPAEVTEKAEETKPAEAPEKAEETKPAEAPEKAEETKPAEAPEKAEETKPAEAPEKAEDAEKASEEGSN